MAEKINPKKFIHLSGCPKGQELIPECEVVYEGEKLDVESAFEKCTKKSLHHKYIPVKDFDLDNLPEHLRTPRIKRLVELRCALTVRCTVHYTSKHRPDKFFDSDTAYPYSDVKGSDRVKRYGTGIIDLGTTIKSDYIHCPCLACKDSKDRDKLKRAWFFHVTTSTHVIYDESEALCSKFDSFFDSDDREEVKTFYGIGFISADTSPDFNYQSDFCKVACATHDEELIKRLWTIFGSSLDSLLNPTTFPPNEVIVSHPHGGSKMISVGEIRHVTVPVEVNYKTNEPFPLKHKFMICRLPLSFKPESSKDALELESIRKQMSLTLRNNKVERLFNTAPLNETDIASRILDSCLEVFLSLNNEIRLYLYNRVEFKKMKKMFTLLISQRLRGKKHPELIDIGFLLWWCFLSCLLDIYNNMDTGSTNSGFGKLETHSLLIQCLYNELNYKPYLREIFDIEGYLKENSVDDIFSSRLHSSLDEMKMTMREILTGNDDMHVDDDIFHEIDTLPIIASHDIHSSEFSNFLHKIKSARKPDDVDYLQPGTDSILPCSNMTFTLPSTAKYAFKHYNDDVLYLIFSPGTTFHFTIGEDIKIKLPIPDKTKFFVKHSFISNNKYFVNYKTPTCPGSSGAPVYLRTYNPHGINTHVHSAGCKDRNRSGLTFQHFGDQSYEKELQKLTHYLRQK